MGGNLQTFLSSTLSEASGRWPLHIRRKDSCTHWTEGWYVISFLDTKFHATTRGASSVVPLLLLYNLHVYGFRTGKAIPVTGRGGP
jgi:hypothetical protein